MMKIDKLKKYFYKTFTVLKVLYVKNITPILKDPFFCSRWDIYGDYRGKKDNQITVRSGMCGKVSEYTYKGHVSMAIEDIYAGIMPFFHARPKNENFKVYLTVQNEALERIIANGLSQRSYGNSFLNEALSDFIGDAVHWLSSYGSVLYEIVYSKDDKENITSFDLVSVSNSNIFKVFNSYYQVIPWWTAKKNRIKAQIVKIPRNKIFRINFPRELGGKRKLIKTWKRLWQLSKVLIPDFVMQAMKENKDIGYNSTEYHNSKDLEIAKITSHLGWNIRGGLNKLTLEYYTWHVYLKSEKTKAILRRHILDSVNKILNGEVLDLKTEIKMEGLPDEEFVENKKNELLKGDVAFGGIFNSFKY